VGADHRVNRSATVAAVALILASGAVGCRKHAPQPPPAASAVPVKPPVDRLGPGELAPGTEVLFGLLLPRGMKVTALFPRVGHAAGPLHAEDVANYVRDRVDVRRVELGVVGTVFSAVHVTGGDPSHVYRIEVNSAEESTEIVMRDVTPVPPPPVDTTLTDEERWRRAGYQPNGMPLDPMKVH
jgi:hypothetical protein